MDNSNTNSYTDNSCCYDEFADKSIRLARRAYSRYALSLVLYQVIVYAVLYGGLFVMGQIFGAEKLQQLLSKEYVFWLLQVVPMYVIAFPCFYLMVKNMRVMRIAKGKMGVGDFLLTLFVAHSVMQIGNYIGQWLNNLISVIIGREVINSTGELISNSSTWILFCVVVIIGPIVEELMFRKLMIDRLSPYGTVSAVIFSAITFGLFHGNFFQFFYAALVGMVLGYVYAKTGKIRYSIILHMIINFFGTIVSLKMSELAEFVDKYLNPESTSSQLIKALRYLNIVNAYSILYILLAIFGAIVLAVALIKGYATLENKRIYRIDAPKLAAASAINLGSILFLICVSVLFVLEIFS